MITYKGYTLIFDFSTNTMFIPTTIKNFMNGKDVKVDDISKAKRLIDKSLGE